MKLCKAARCRVYLRRWDEALSTNCHYSLVSRHDRHHHVQKWASQMPRRLVPSCSFQSFESHGLLLAETSGEPARLETAAFAAKQHCRYCVKRGPVTNAMPTVRTHRSFSPSKNQPQGLETVVDTTSAGTWLRGEACSEKKTLPHTAHTFTRCWPRPAQSPRRFLAFLSHDFEGFAQRVTRCSVADAAASTRLHNKNGRQNSSLPMSRM